MKCKYCGNEDTYNKEFDSYYCDKCEEWLGRACKKPNCEFHLKRPHKPVISA
ncbi:MAG: hypothetical protein WC867_03315 [Candidatus Pacearchaeota archaeon]|jgi:hypothetical protein